VGECRSDEELIRLFVSNGDRAAFEALVRRHVVPIRRLLYGLFRGHREDMEDAEQEVILALFRSLGKFGFRSSFSTFLYRLVRNRAIDLIRRRERERRSLERFGRGREPAAAPHPEEVAVGEVARSEAMALLGALRVEERTVVLLREVEGLSLEEIARVLRLPRGTVKSRLHRARARIGRALAEGGGAPAGR
jgi:RNA polymerase sigma-70 factor (ECF subfamily)